MGSLAKETIRDIEMYLHLLLLISPAFGMPSSAVIDVGEGIINQLDALPSFTERSKAIFNDSKLFENVAESLNEAEEAILEIDGELALFESDELQFEDNYFPEYNKAKQYFKESRQNLRKLADRTVKGVRALKVLLKDLDESNDSFLLITSLDEMKDLMIETLEALKEALGKYNSASEAFENLNSSIAKQNGKLEKMVTKGSTEYEEWVTKTRAGSYGTLTGTTIGFIIADIFGCLGICSAVSSSSNVTTNMTIESEIDNYEDETTNGRVNSEIDNYEDITSNGTVESEIDKSKSGLENFVYSAYSAIHAAFSASTTYGIDDEIEKSTAELEKLKMITDRILESGKRFDTTIKDAIGFLTDEIDLIKNWTSSAEVVNRNIEKYPEEYLKKYIAVRTIFVNGLDDLEKSAEDYLAQPVDILA